VIGKIDSNRFVLANRTGSFRFDAIDYTVNISAVTLPCLAANLVTYLTARLENRK